MAGMTPDPDTIEQLVSRYLAFWERADIDGLMSMYDRTMQYHDMPSGEVIGYDDLQRFLTDTFVREPNQRLTLQESVFVEGNSAFIYWTQSVVSKDAGRVVGMNGVELIVFRDGKINSIHEFYDFQGTGSEAAVTPEKGTHQEKMTKLGLTDDMMRQLASELTDYLKREKPYLQPELTLSTVSGHLGYTRNQISFVINHLLDRTFYDLVNARRVDYAIGKMESPKDRLSILELAIDSGFNSVSGFYNAFKKRTGKTPAKYQRDLPV